MQIDERNLIVGGIGGHYDWCRYATDVVINPYAILVKSSGKGQWGNNLRQIWALDQNENHIKATGVPNHIWYSWS